MFLNNIFSVMYDKITDFTGNIISGVKTFFGFKDSQKRKTEEIKKEFDNFAKTGEFDKTTKEEKEYKEYIDFVDYEIIENEYVDISKDIENIYNDKNYIFDQKHISIDKKFNISQNMNNLEYYTFDNVKSFKKPVIDSLDIILDKTTFESYKTNYKKFKENVDISTIFGVKLKYLIDRYFNIYKYN